MIFEKQDYQQECIDNILTLLENFNFKQQNAKNLKACFANFHTSIPKIIFTTNTTITFQRATQCGVLGLE